MAIPNFKPEEFSNNLARQAKELVPDDLNDYQRNYVVEKLRNFCILAGNAINNDNLGSFNCDEANVIVQLIGEWTFHKNIDLIRAKIPEDNWDPVLQQVAFAVFETAKKVQTEKIERNKALKMIEDVVKDSYSKSLVELARNGKIKEEKLPEILAFSNIDEMATQNEPEMTKEQENKILKCASLALVLKKMPENKIKKILSELDAETAREIVYFINTPDLEKRIDSQLANSFLSGFKQSLLSSNTQLKKILKGRISKLKNLYDEYLILKQLRFERPFLKQYVQNSLSQKNQSKKLSPYVENIVYEYIVSKLSA